jgi:hypothetical protein
MSLHDVKRIGDSASADCVAGSKYPQHTNNTVKVKDCLPQKIFNLDKTGPKLKHELEAVMLRIGTGGGLL